MTPEELAVVVAAVRAGLESPAEKTKRDLDRFIAEMDGMSRAANRERRAKEQEEAKQREEELRRNPPLRSSLLGEPCPFANLPAASLTHDQRYSLMYWDDPRPGVRARARAVALPAGELSAEAVTDIGRWCRDALVADEYGTLGLTALQRGYDESPGAQSTKGATEAAWREAFAAVGLASDSTGRFNVRVKADDELVFDSSTDEAEEPLDIVDGLIPAGVQLVLVGDQASGKTTAMASLLSAVANGSDWLGRPTLRCASAIVNFDGREVDLKKILRDVGANGKVGINSYSDVDLTSDRFWTMLEKRFGGRPALIAIDSLSRGSGDVDEKDARFAKPILRAAEISSRHPITFVWIHHTPVTVRGKNLNDWLRGTSALGAAFDIGFGLSKVSAKAMPRETIIQVECLKMRPRGIVPPPTFKLRVSDSGISLHDETKRKAPLTNDEKVFAAVVTTPGLTLAGIQEAANMNRTLVIEARDRLEADGKIVNRGTSTKPKWFAV